MWFKKTTNKITTTLDDSAELLSNTIGDFTYAFHVNVDKIVHSVKFLGWCLVAASAIITFGLIFK